MKRSTLRKSKPEYIIRFAKWLDLSIYGMSHNQIANLIYWRITRSTVRYF